MLNLDPTKFISLSEAAAILPGRPSLCSLHRWTRRGVRGVRLETLLVGGKRFTTAEALQKFADAVTAAGASAPTRSAAVLSNRRAISAEAELERDGI